MAGPELPAAASLSDGSLCIQMTGLPGGGDDPSTTTPYIDLLSKLTVVEKASFDLSFAVQPSIDTPPSPLAYAQNPDLASYALSSDWIRVCKEHRERWEKHVERLEFLDLVERVLGSGNPVSFPANPFQVAGTDIGNGYLRSNNSFNKQHAFVVDFGDGSTGDGGGVNQKGGSDKESIESQYVLLSGRTGCEDGGHSSDSYRTWIINMDGGRRSKKNGKKITVAKGSSSNGNGNGQESSSSNDRALRRSFANAVDGGDGGEDPWGTCTHHGHMNIMRFVALLFSLLVLCVVLYLLPPESRATAVPLIREIIRALFN